MDGMFVARIDRDPTTEAASEAGSPACRTRPIWYVLDGQEHRADVPVGEAMWDAVTDMLGQRLRRQILSVGAPRYDEGTRNWQLPIRVQRRFLGPREVIIPVRW
ncbi:hypothetical protein ACE7GA_15055 [Roseomonas sp. CCTCC AB2023176]|uniref:hypothetical protein n=1 Tax=Roseomonas sp. CCTCC AB2023176 TaxID=3342640 RepID=UPI0035DE5226